MSTPLRILGIEGTAWAASASVFEVPVEYGGGDERVQPGAFAPDEIDAGREEAHVSVESEAYEPESGGIHPREAAEHMHEAIPRVVEAAMEHATERRRNSPRERESARDQGRNSEPESPVDAVAFSQGPGLGPCLRIVGTAARSVAGRLDVPLLGVNHMVAHLEIGRYTSGFSDPICLNASGANAHLLAHRDGRYRVIGETMDTGVGNAIDKFTRHVGWSHPGGPKVERAAAEGEYVDLPYVVKGMDFSFSGITSAAKEAVDGEASDELGSAGGRPVEDVCRGLQETIFAMLTEVSERALSLTGRDELVLGGGVGQNARLREMLETMCADRGATFHAPEAQFLRDNAGMIAVLGAKMYAAGETLPIEDSRIDPNYRPDQVAVSWREADPTTASSGDTRPSSGSSETRGAEAVVDLDPEAGTVRKRRVSKSYRHPSLDERLRRERTTLEARLTSLARREGVPTPLVRDVDVSRTTIEFEYVGEADLRDGLTHGRCADVGRHLASLHEAGIVHGDPTPRNVRTGPDRTYLIDFGLGYHSDHVEDYAMDLHVFERSLDGTASGFDELRDAFREGYRERDNDRVLERLVDVEGRGRYV